MTGDLAAFFTQTIRPEMLGSFLFPLYQLSFCFAEATARSHVPPIAYDRKGEGAVVTGDGDGADEMSDDHPLSLLSWKIPTEPSIITNR